MNKVLAQKETKRPLPRPLAISVTIHLASCPLPFRKEGLEVGPECQLSVKILAICPQKS